MLRVIRERSVKTNGFARLAVMLTQIMSAPAVADRQSHRCLGNVSIKNITEGWDISSNATRSGKAQMVFQPYGCSSGTAKTIAMVFYKDLTDLCRNGIDVSAKMTGNNRGPASFVLIAPENFSPNSPNGEYLEN